MRAPRGTKAHQSNTPGKSEKNGQAVQKKPACAAPQKQSAGKNEKKPKQDVEPGAAKNSEPNAAGGNDKAKNSNDY